LEKEKEEEEEEDDDDHGYVMQSEIEYDKWDEQKRRKCFDCPNTIHEHPLKLICLSPMLLFSFSGNVGLRCDLCDFDAHEDWF
jgi:hypothetical protein